VYIFLDTETTGVTPHDRIISICWALYDGPENRVSSTHLVIIPNGFTIPP
jgi:DNA polymerase III epsilon subunit-like protein